MIKRTFILTDAGEETRAAQDTVLAAVESQLYDASSCFAIRLALEEALANAFKHGNKNDPAKSVRLHCHIGPDEVVLDVEDDGRGFDPHAVPDPTEEENLEIPCGRGIVLMRSFMTEVAFNPLGNRVRLTFVRPDGGMPRSQAQ